MGPLSGLSLRGCKSPAHTWNMEHKVNVQTNGGLTTEVLPEGTPTQTSTKWTPATVAANVESE